MNRKLLLSLVLGLCLFPAAAMADVSARQDSCVTYELGGVTYTTTYFSIINFSLPSAVCGFTFVPEPQPPLPQCTMIGCGSPAGWACGLNPDGGASWTTGSSCIPPGGFTPEFSYTLDPGFCCYVVTFYDAAGAILAEQEECFCDKPVQSQSSSWGGVKAIYR